MRWLRALGHALAISGSMTWEILWALILGFGLSAVVQAVVRRSSITRLLGDDRPKTLALASGLGAASSSCSYAAVALARSLFRKGASFTAAMAFEIASTNLVIELGIILALLIGERHAKVLEASIQWNYTTVLNIVFLALAAALVFRFVRSGGRPMLAMMGGPPADDQGEGHHQHDHHEEGARRKDGKDQPA